MSFKDDIRSYYEREAERVPMPYGLRSQVVEDVARKRIGPRRSTQWAAAVAALLAVAIVAGLLAAGALRHRPTPAGPLPKANLQSPLPTTFPSGSPLQSGKSTPAPLPSPTPSSIAPSWSVVEVDPVDSQRGWALLQEVTFPPGGGAGTPTFFVASTSDGGATWSSPKRIGGLAPGQGNSGEHIQFVDRNNGFVYGSTPIFATHDGGHTWSDASVYEWEYIAIAGTTAWTWAVVYPCAKGTVCPYEVHLSRDQGRHWTQTWMLPGGFSPTQLIAFGAGGLVVVGSNTGDLELTSDGGHTWKTIPGRCSANTGKVMAATSNGTELWETCSGDFPDFLPRTLYLSEDGGVSWAGASLPAVGAVQTTPMGSGLSSPSSGEAVLVTIATPVENTFDAGTTWLAVTSAVGFDGVVFATPRYAWALSTDGTIWATSDSGAAWTPLAAQPTTG